MSDLSFKCTRQPRIVLYSHDTLGFGHLRRNLLIAGTLKQMNPVPDILMIAGMSEAGAFRLPDGVDLLSLPAYGKRSDGSYHARNLGLNLADLANLRAQTIKGALLSYDPDLVIIDNVPRGAQQELDIPLDALRKRGRAKVVLGLRDVLDRPDVVRAQWLLRRNFAAIRARYDEVWIYGDPNFFDPVTEYGFGSELSSITCHLGYLDQAARLLDAPKIETPDNPFILCVVGGGRDGAALCNAFANARLPAGHTGILITGIQMPDAAQAEISEIISTRPDIEMMEFLPEPISLMAQATRIIAMGGYNTVTEALSLKQPILIVPRTCPRYEQLIRAERLAAHGAISMLHPEALDATALTRWMAGPTPQADKGRSMLDMGGLEQLKRQAASLLELPVIAGVAA